jgi:hypothetical protein
VTDPTALPEFAPPPDDDPLRGRVFETLLDEGFRPAVDEDGDVAFRAQGQLLFVRCLPTEPPLIRVFGQWVEHDVPGGELTRLRAANAVVGRFNLIKATVVDDRLVVAVDLVISDGIALAPLRGASIEAVLHSVQTWYAAVREYAGGGPAPGGPDGLVTGGPEYAGSEYPGSEYGGAGYADYGGAQYVGPEYVGPEYGSTEHGGPASAASDNAQHPGGPGPTW